MSDEMGIRANLEEIRKLKYELERNIEISLSKLTLEFSDKTCFDVANIRINIVETTTLGDKRPRFVLGRCTIELERI